MASALYRVFRDLSIQGSNLLKTFLLGYPSESLPLLVNAPCYKHNGSKHRNLTEILKESILWAVPKKRRTIEKRRNRRFGWPKYIYKMLVPKTNILICPKCGSYREAGMLCPQCYARINEQTTGMQSAIEESLGITIPENEVIVLYQDDERLNPEFYKGKRVIEIHKDRPKLFSDNLLERSTQGLASTKEIIEKK